MKTPCPNEAYGFRNLFASHFGENTSAAETVGGQGSVACSSKVALKWNKAFQGRADASGRSGAGAHESADDTSYETKAPGSPRVSCRRSRFCPLLGQQGREAVNEHVEEAAVNEHVEVYDYQTSDALEFHVLDYDYLTNPDADLAKREVYRTLALGDDKEHGASGKRVKGKLTVMCGSPGMAR